MQKEKIKSYISSNTIDKNGNIIAVNDYLLHDNSICIFLALSNKNKILVGYSNGKISEIYPKNTIRIDTEILNLDKAKNNLINSVKAFNNFKISSYYQYKLFVTNIFINVKENIIPENKLYNAFSNLYEHYISILKKTCYYLPDTETYYSKKNLNNVLYIDNQARIEYDMSYSDFYIILNSYNCNNKIKFLQQFYEVFYNYCFK